MKTFLPGYKAKNTVILSFNMTHPRCVIQLRIFFTQNSRTKHTAYLLIYLLTCSLTPWSRVLLENLTGFQLVKKFTPFYETRRFITPFTSARYLSLSWASLIQSIPPHPTFWRSSLILSFHLRLGFSSGLFPTGFPTKTLYKLLPNTRYMPRPSFYHPKNICWGRHIIKLLIIYFSPFPFYLLPLRLKYSPQHPILKHPQPTFLLQCERPSLTPKKKNIRQSYSSVHFNPKIIGWQTGRQKILRRMIANIPWLQSALKFFRNRILICPCFSQIFWILPPCPRNCYQSIFVLWLHPDPDRHTKQDKIGYVFRLIQP